MSDHSDDLDDLLLLANECRTLTLEEFLAKRVPLPMSAPTGMSVTVRCD